MNEVTNCYAIQGNVVGRKDRNGPRGGGGTGTSASPSISSIYRASHTLCFNHGQITSRQNGNRPQWDEPCHTLSATDAYPPTVVIRRA